MKERADQLMEQMQKRGVDAVIVTSRINRMYLTGFTGSAGTVYLSNTRRVLITDFRYVIQAKEQTGGCFEIVEAQRGGAISTLRELISKEGKRNLCVGFEDDRTTVREFSALQDLPCKLEPVSDDILQLRKIKSPEEAKRLQRAQRTAEEAFSRLLPQLHAGMTERSAANQLIYLMRECGASDVSFAPIIASGPNGAMCHAEPGDREFAAGDLIVMDFGCIVDGYCSDMTRTIGVGKIDGQKREIYDIVLNAHNCALSALRPGMTGQELDSIARRIIEDAGYGPCFGHSLGHGFGLEIHEAPTAGPNSKEILASGMTVTVEPGIYVEGLCGVRIEDCCMLTDDGAIDFVSTPKELISI